MHNITIFTQTKFLVVFCSFLLSLAAAGSLAASTIDLLLNLIAKAT